MSNTSALIVISAAMVVMVVGAAQQLPSNGLRGTPPQIAQEPGPDKVGRNAIGGGTEELLAVHPMQELFDMHNAVRCIHGAAPLSYNTVIEATAASYAATITNSENCGKMLQHSEPEDRYYWGENLDMCWTTDLTVDCYSAGATMVRLYDEEVANRVPSQYLKHATQIIWKDTTSFGCAVDSCIKAGRRYNYLVCNYSPAGNVDGQYEEQVEAPSQTRATCGYP